MHLVVDGRALSERRGAGTVLSQVLPAVAAEDGVEVTALVTAGTEVPDGVRPQVVRRSLAGRFADLEHRVRRAAELKDLRADVVWSPFLDPPTSLGCPWVQTVHDVIPLVVEDPVFRRDRRRWRRRLVRMRRADRVVTVSQHTSELLVGRFGFDASRVAVVHNGVASSFRPAPAEHRRPGRPYLLMVAGWGPHKGFAEAMEVVARVAEAGRPHRLVVAGPGDAWMRARAERQRGESRRPERVELAGFVDDLVAAYWDADVVLVPSRYEGFGLPLLEAMACARPVVAFANSSLTEVAGDGAALVRDGDVGAMAAEVLRLLDDPAGAAALAERAVERAARFTWEDAARRYVELFRGLAAR